MRGTSRMRQMVQQANRQSLRAGPGRMEIPANPLARRPPPRGTTSPALLFGDTHRALQTIWQEIQRIPGPEILSEVEHHRSVRIRRATYSKPQLLRWCNNQTIPIWISPPPTYHQVGNGSTDDTHCHLMLCRHSQMAPPRQLRHLRMLETGPYIRGIGHYRTRDTKLEDP